MGLFAKVLRTIGYVAQKMGVRGTLLAGVSIFPLLNMQAAQATTTPAATMPLTTELTPTVARQNTAAPRIEIVRISGISYQQFTRADGSAIRIPVNERWRDVFEVKMHRGRQIMERVTQPQTAIALRNEYNQFIAQTLVVPVAPPLPLVLAPAREVLVNSGASPQAAPIPAALVATELQAQAAPTEYTDSSGRRFFEVRVDGQRMIISQPDETRITAVMRLVQSSPSGPVTRQFVNNMQQVEAAARAVNQDPQRYIDATRGRMRIEASARLAAAQRPRTETAAPVPAATTQAPQTERLVMRSGTYYERVTTGRLVQMFRVDAATGRNILLTNRADIAEVRANAVPVPDAQPAPAQSAVAAAINLGQVQQQITERIITPPVTAETTTPEVPTWVNRPDPLQPHAQPPAADEVNPVTHTIYTAGNWQRLSNDPNAQNQLSLQALMRAERDTGVVFCKVREADGTWYTNLIPCPQDRLINRILDRSRGLMMEGVHNIFNGFAYAMSPNREDRSEARQAALRAAHHATLAAAAERRVLPLAEQVAMNRAAIRQDAARLVESLNANARPVEAVPVRAARDDGIAIPRPPRPMGAARTHRV